MWDRKVTVIGLAQNAIASFEADRAMLVAENRALKKELERVRADRDWWRMDRDRLLGALTELQTAVRNRHEAEAEVQRLKRLRDVEWAQFTARNSSPTLH
jgi:hypothetical protein